MTTTPEEKVNRDTWRVLQKIKREHLLLEEAPIEYRLTTAVGTGITPRNIEIKVIYKLAREKTIKVIESQTNWRGYHGYFTLEVLQPKFDEVYEKYQKACDVQSYLTTSQKKLVNEGKTSANIPEFGQLETKVENDHQKEINDWLKTKDSWTLQKIWQVVSALNSEWQLRDKNEFSIPLDKFERAKIKNQNDLEAVLTTLHKRKFIEVSRKINEQPPSKDPNIPGGMSIWSTLDGHPEILDYSDTRIRIMPEEFSYLRGRLIDLVKSGSKEKIDMTTEQKQNHQTTGVLVKETVSESSTATGDYDYEVAFSFAGEKRKYVEKVAQYLKDKGVSVFYDKNEEEEIAMWGKDLMDYLGSILSSKARKCVMFISKEYAEKSWPNFERQIIQARFLVDEGSLLPVRFDSTEIKGLPSTIKYIDISSKSPEDLSEMLIKKVGKGDSRTRKEAVKAVKLANRAEKGN